MVFSSLLFIFAFLPICLCIYTLFPNIKAKNIVPWLEMDKEKLEAKVLRIPARADVDLEVAENLIIELYSKN